MRYWAMYFAEQRRGSLREIPDNRSLKRETPLEAGFRHSGSAYLPPGQTSCEAGVHHAGFCAPVRKFKSSIVSYQVAVYR
jgi:hypothetical protein